MTDRVHRAGLQVAGELAEFVEKEALAGTDLDAAHVWSGFASIVADLTPRNRALLAERDRLQAAIDAWHEKHAGDPHDPVAYRALLEEIGYLLPEPDDIRVTTTGVDAEIAGTAGPQLVVPVLNARYALNAANARWGSLYDALYGTDAIPEDDGASRSGGYNPKRGARVIEYARRLLDDIAPLTSGRHADGVSYSVVDGGLRLALPGDASTTLANPSALAGYTGDPAQPESILLVHHGLHVEIVIDGSGSIGATDAAGVQDVVLESAVTTIVDFEDSVAAVDAEDKVAAYRNWLQLNRDELTADVSKGADRFVRRLAGDRTYTTPSGDALVLPGRALLFVRNVGHHMTTPAVLDAEGAEVFEGFLDALVTTLTALPGCRSGLNTRTGAVYIVKPKLHGPDEVALTVDLFARVEDLLGLHRNTIKLGLMDEERRTTLNLKASIAAASERLVFINTGFLDRSGDEIHTAMAAGPIVRKADMKNTRWIAAYEKQNVEIGLACGLRGRAQIGKGMWAMPDLMADMLAQKGGQLRAGASTAWVPSPTAATLHALHYHEVDVAAVQREIENRLTGASHRDVEGLLMLPVGDPARWSEEDRARHVDTNTQSILGYVVRWIEQGIGCSKVPDIDDVALMEDRATLRISSQLLANWLRHGVVSAKQVQESLRRLATKVDAQNAGDAAYRPMAPDPDASLAFRAASVLIFDGGSQPNGYTEAILHRYRSAAKSAVATHPSVSG